MASERQIAANRKNAKKSSGPQSGAGRRRSRRNALRHGLAIAIASSPAFSSEIDVLTAIICADTGQHTAVFARQFAEAEMDLWRIRKIRASQFNLIAGNSDLQLEDLSRLNDGLAKLERYELRALSRRKNAMREIERG